MPDGILSGIRVIDCATYIAAPAAAAVLSDFGAEVIKVERPPHGDPYRALYQVAGAPVSEHNYCWLLDARNKKSIALNLGDDAGREALLKLAATADVFITNYQPQLIAKFRLDYEALRAVNPRLIYAGVTGYGEVGPEAEKPGYDMTGYWARSGLMQFIHNADAEPALSPMGFGDHPTAMSLFGAILLALYQRERTGQGMKVSTTLMANGAWSNSCLVQASLCGATHPPKRTRKTPHNPLVNHYQTGDGRRFLFCLLDNEKDWPRVCRAMGRTEWIGDARFHTVEARCENAVELVTLLDAEFARHGMEEWTRRFAENDVTWGPASDLDAVAADQQMAINGLFPVMESAPGGPVRIVSSPIMVDGSEKNPPGRPPEVGEHTREVLASLGYTPQQVDELIGRGVVKG